MCKELAPQRDLGVMMFSVATPNFQATTARMFGMGKTFTRGTRIFSG